MERAIALIKQFEGLRLKSYVPPEGTKNGYAIGYGFTSPIVTKECVISEAWAEKLLQEHIRNQVLAPLAAILRPPKPLNENQIGAIISLVYNIGVGAFKDSTLLKKINAGDFAGAAQEFDRWNKVGGKPVAGLTRRRAAERALFEKV